MNKLLIFAWFILLAPFAWSADALYSGLLTNLADNPEVVIEELTLPPGLEGRAHRHDAWVYVYVVSGEVDMQVAGGPLTRVSAGEVFVENPDDVHTVMNNPSQTNEAVFVAFIIKEAGAPVAKAP